MGNQGSCHYGIHRSNLFHKGALFLHLYLDYHIQGACCQVSGFYFVETAVFLYDIQNRVLLTTSIMGALEAGRFSSTRIRIVTTRQVRSATS